jgi:hypothetical protein
LITSDLESDINEKERESKKELVALTFTQVFRDDC